MSNKLPPHFVQLVWDAAHKSFWRKRALQDFLRRCGIQESFIATWTEDETKRDFLNRLFPRMERSNSGRQTICHLANALSEQHSFPDLEGWDESLRMKEDAKRAVSALKSYLAKKANESAQEQSIAQARRRSEDLRIQQIRRQQDLGKLSALLDALASRQGTREGGSAFEEWFFDLIYYFELPHRRPYKTDGREIDGSITIGDTTYLVELKFKKTPVGAPDVDIFRQKVENKADNTMGIMVSMSGYTEPGMKSASGHKSPILLLDFNHIYAVLRGVLKMDELVGRVRQHASQTGRAFFRLDELE